MGLSKEKSERLLAKLDHGIPEIQKNHREKSAVGCSRDNRQPYKSRQFVSVPTAGPGETRKKKLLGKTSGEGAISEKRTGNGVKLLKGFHASDTGTDKNGKREEEQKRLVAGTAK